MKITPERILEELGRRGGAALTSRELAQRLGVQRQAERSLRRMLRELVREGQLTRKDRRYRLARRDGLVEGVFTPGPGAGGQVTAGARRSWRVSDARGAEAGDRVLLWPDAAAPRDAPRGEILEVLSTRRSEWVGIVNRELHGAVVTPYRDDQEWGIRVAARDLAGAKDGDVVVVVAGARGRGRIQEVLGRPGDAEADYRAVVWRRRLPVEFPADVLAEADALPAAPDPDDVAARKDLRPLAFVTIDPATARDHDDAVCVEARHGAGWRLWVAIADVAHYVPEGSALDREALRRGNSVYFPDRAIPMLPERLSAGLCSLVEAEERLAMVAELEVEVDGRVSSARFHQAVIRSRARFAYEQVAESLATQKWSDAHERDGVADSLRRLGELSKKLTQHRFAAGSIDFDLPSAEIVLDDAGYPVDIVEAPRTLAHRAIEEAMLAANRAVAERLDAVEIPCVFRIHEAPAPGDAETLCDLLEAFGLLERRGGRRERTLAPHDLARSLHKVAGRPEERLVNMIALRSMQQARYASANRGHFALAFRHYLHFTSPIRRYADLVVHRALKDWLAGGVARERAAIRGESLDAVATRISWRERVAMDAEREIVDLKKCAFMSRHLGQEFDGTLTGVARHGFYVTLDEFFVEGLVHVSTLQDYVELDEKSYALVGRGSRERYRLGDRFRILVDGVNPVKAWINFSVVKRLPRRKLDGTS